jgi:FkbM family methyltransferase
MKVFFQIGTNNGNDQFRQICIQNKPDMIVLVEANSKHLNSIKDNYKDLLNVHIINKAIYYKDNDEVELFIPAKDGIYGEPGENKHTYTDGQFSLLPMNDWGDKKNMCSFKAQTITFDTICEQLNIKNIEYLQIDTEGFDSEIIKMIDLDKYNIKNIRYEKWGFPIERFTKYNNNENINEYGVEGMKLIEQKLLKYNYQLRDINDRDGNDIIATKI